MINKSKHSFVFKLKGTSHEAEAENLSTVLSSLAEMLKHLQTLGYPDSSCVMKVKANREASFEIESIFALSQVPNLITSIFQGSSSIEGAK